MWRLEAGSHFFQVSTFNQSGEPYVVAEPSWPVLSYWKEQINDRTMTLQKLHARYPDAAIGSTKTTAPRRAIACSLTSRFDGTCSGTSGCST